MTNDRASAEAFLRQHAVLLVVGEPHIFAQGVSLDPLKADKTYILAFLEVE